MSRFDTLPPLSLYIHFPWCVRKCPYCDFNSHATEGAIPQATYIEALLADLEHDLPLAGGREIGSIFLGGGTPSLFAPEWIEQLFNGLREHLRFADDIEITLEANPGTVEQGLFRGYREAGVNRLSLGIQSFDDRLLQAVGRIHDGREAIAAVERGQRAGFSRINLDLMFGLPGASRKQTLADLDTALSLDPGHISWYQLTLEPNTPFHHQPPIGLPDDDTLWAAQQEGVERLDSHGYRQYEISAYSREGQPCRHNLNYWRFGDYLGIGAGAHAKLTTPGGVIRRWRLRHPRDYLRHAGGPAVIAGETRLDRGDLLVEFMMNALRLNEGVPAPLFTERTAIPLAEIEAQLTAQVERGLLIRQDGRIAPSDRGRRFLNELLESFLPE